jgi:hypothetical protein
MMDQAGIPLGLASVERLLQSIQHEVAPHRTADTPTNDTASKDVDDESNIDESLPGGK